MNALLYGPRATKSKLNKQNMYKQVDLYCTFAVCCPHHTLLLGVFCIWGPQGLGMELPAP